MSLEEGYDSPEDLKEANKLVEQMEEIHKALNGAGFKVDRIRDFRIIDVTTADYGYRTVYPMIDISVHVKGEESGIRDQLKPRAPEKGFWKRLKYLFRGSND